MLLKMRERRENGNAYNYGGAPADVDLIIYDSHTANSPTVIFQKESSLPLARRNLPDRASGIVIDGLATKPIAAIRSKQDPIG